MQTHVIINDLIGRKENVDIKIAKINFVENEKRKQLKKWNKEGSKIKKGQKKKGEN